MAQQVPPLPFITDDSPLAAEIKLGAQRIGARTDGGLQIFLPQDTKFVAWDRSYYEIALEVFLILSKLILGKALLQIKY